jgi:hypothetical protein
MTVQDFFFMFSMPVLVGGFAEANSVIVSGVKHLLSRATSSIEVRCHVAQPNKPANTAARFKLWPILYVSNGFTGSGCGTFVPHFLHVRRTSSFQKSSIAWLKCWTISAQSK